MTEEKMMEFDSSNINLFDLISEVHDTAKEKGFWNTMDSVLSKMPVLNSPGGSVEEFTEEEILQVKKAFLVQKMMLVVSEMGEAVEADRVSRNTIWYEFREMYKDLKRKNHRQEFCFVTAFEGEIKDTFEDEIADVIIRLLDLCAKLEIDIIKHISFKMSYNKTREKLHGKEY